MKSPDCELAPAPRRDNRSSQGFFQAVYALVAQIPPGKVMTYGQISDLLGRASARYVGYAMRAAPENRRLPCHRVLNRKGELAPGLTFGGADIQRAALEAEGAVFDEKGRVDLAQCLWRPGPEAFADLDPDPGF